MKNTIAKTTATTTAMTAPAAQAKVEKPAMMALLDKPVRGMVASTDFGTWLKQETGELIPRFTVKVFQDGTQYEMTLWGDRAKKAAQYIRRGTLVKLDGQNVAQSGYTRADGDYVPVVKVKGYLEKITW